MSLQEDDLHLVGDRHIGFSRRVSERGRH
jgi:hypothetical protein